MVDGGRRRSRALSTKDCRGRVLGRGDDGRQVAAGAVQVWLYDVECERDGDGGVKGVAAVLQHGHPRLAGQPVRRGHHAERACQFRSCRKHG